MKFFTGKRVRTLKHIIQTYMKLVKTKLNNILDNKTSPLLELVSKQRVKDIIDSDGSSFKVPWFGQLMTGPQLIAHLVQINMWLSKLQHKHH